MTLFCGSGRALELFEVSAAADPWGIQLEYRVGPLPD